MRQITTSIQYKPNTNQTETDKQFATQIIIKNGESQNIQNIHVSPKRKKSSFETNLGLKTAEQQIIIQNIVDEMISDHEAESITQL